MKGPGLRLELDVRRVWRCAVCGTERHTRGSTTFVACHFCQDHPSMSLIEPRRAVRAAAPPLDSVIDLHPEDVDAPAFVPVHLREPEDAPPVDSESTETALQPEPVPEVEPSEIIETPTAEAQSSSPDEPSPARKSRRKKKSRRKRKQQTGDAKQADPPGADGTTPPAPQTVHPPSPAAADDSFSVDP